MVPEGRRRRGQQGRSIGKKSPKVFYSSPAMSQINYSEAIEEEGFFDKARRGWALAAQEWGEYGDLVIEHSTGVKLKLGDVPRLEALVEKLTEELAESCAVTWRHPTGDQLRQGARSFGGWCTRLRGGGQLDCASDEPQRRLSPCLVAMCPPYGGARRLSADA